MKVFRVNIMVKCVMRYLNLNQILGVINGVFLNDQKFSDWAPNEIYVVSICEGPPNFFLSFISIYVRSLHTFVIGLF